MTDTAELVQRLRRKAKGLCTEDPSDYLTHLTVAEALACADALEAQARRIVELEAAIKAVADLEPDLPFYIWGQINNAVPSKAKPSKALKPPQEGE